MLQQQVLAWETTPSGFSFQSTSDSLIIEHDQYLQTLQHTLPGQVIFPISELDDLERFIQKIKAIKNGEVVEAPPALSIAS